MILSDPYAIFNAARLRWEAQRYPDWLSYTARVRTVRDGRAEQRRYHGYYAADGALHVSMQSDEELAQPYTPHGLTYAVTLSLGFGVVMGPPLPQTTVVLAKSPPEQGPDTLGVPVLAPNYSFGIAAPNIGRRQAAFDNSLKTIASVQSSDRPYAIELSGMETFDGRPAYHLRLRALRRPERYRLREMWIDAGTYAVLAVTVSGNFTQGPALGVPWTVAFQQVDGLEFIAWECALAPLRYGRGKTYEQACVSFEAIAAGAGSRPLALSIPDADSRYSLTEPQ